jgi:ABC-type transport system involved in cytochrome bd biosynthesis fused ATPase/permease subunit
VTAPVLGLRCPTDAQDSPLMTASSPPAAVELVAVGCRFRTPADSWFEALGCFNIAAAAGEFVAIVGPTGC